VVHAIEVGGLVAGESAQRLLAGGVAVEALEHDAAVALPADELVGPGTDDILLLHAVLLPGVAIEHRLREDDRLHAFDHRQRLEHRPERLRELHPDGRVVDPIE
jgi:hypothetical protein